jgi:hypothetical protein
VADALNVCKVFHVTVPSLFENSSQLTINGDYFIIE